MLSENVVLHKIYLDDNVEIRMLIGLEQSYIVRVLKHYTLFIVYDKVTCCC